MRFMAPSVGAKMERTEFLRRTKVAEAMLLLDVFGLTELAEQGSVAYGTVAGVIGTIPEGFVELWHSAHAAPTTAMLAKAMSLNPP